MNLPLGSIATLKGVEPVPNGDPGTGLNAPLLRSAAYAERLSGYSSTA
jgi:hypothetical protein